MEQLIRALWTFDFVIHEQNENTALIEAEEKFFLVWKNDQAAYGLTSMQLSNRENLEWFVSNEYFTEKYPEQQSLVKAYLQK